MNERTKTGKLKLKSNRKYNKAIHFNNGNEWTVQEIKQIMDDKIHTLTELGELIGRSPNSISLKRFMARQGKFDLILK